MTPENRDLMDLCARCGHALGIGRFCVNCGHPVGEPAPPPGTDDWRISTAERPAVPGLPPSTPPPPLPPLPPQARYPLYADETPAETTMLAPHAAGQTLGPPSRRSTRRGAPPWVLLVAVALLLVAGTGVLLLLGDDSDSGAATDRTSTSAAPTTDPVPSREPQSTGSSSATPPTTPPTTSPAQEHERDEPRDVARDVVDVMAPPAARPSRDVDGNAVRYDAFNMLDGQADTAWRMVGDGAGSVVTFQLAAPTALEQVGLINGYAKFDPGYDGYTANRRVTEVEWVFDDGTTVPQSLIDDPAPQVIEVDVTTSTVELRILAVTEPGQGPSGRDYTAISEVALVGVAG